MTLLSLSHIFIFLPGRVLAEVVPCFRARLVVPLVTSVLQEDDAVLVAVAVVRFAVAPVKVRERISRGVPRPGSLETEVVSADPDRPDGTDGVEIDPDEVVLLTGLDLGKEGAVRRVVCLALSLQAYILLSSLSKGCYLFHRRPEPVLLRLVSSCQRIEEETGTEFLRSVPTVAVVTFNTRGLVDYR